MTVPLPDPPPLPGITWRPARVGDARAIVALQDACFEAEGGHREVESEILDRWESDSCSVEEDSLVAVKDDGSVIAVAWSYVPTIGKTKWRAFDDNKVHPSYWDTEIPVFVRRWWEARSSLRLNLKQDGLPRCLWAMAYDWQARKVKLLTSHGYKAARYFDEIERDLCDPIASRQLPDGITVRTYEDAPLSDSLLVHNAAFTDHWGSQPISESRWSQNWNEFHVATASFVAYDGDEPVGYLMSAAFPHDFKDKGRSEAWVEGLGTVRSHRKRGIASTLVTLAMEDFKRLGMEYAVLGVDSESPTGAHHLYESLGFVHHRREIAYIKNISIEPYG